MIETRYLSFEGIKTKNEVAGDLAEYYDLTTANDEFLDTSNDEEVEDFLLQYDYELELYLKNDIYRIDVEVNQTGKALRLPLQQFKLAIKDVEYEDNFLITYLTDHNLISTIDISVSNADFYERDYSLILYEENDNFTFFVFNKDHSTLLSHNNVSLDEVEKLIKDDFTDSDLNSNFKIEFEEVRVKDSLELDMLKMSFVDRGFPKNHFLKTTDKNGSNFYNTSGEAVWHSTLSLDEVDVDLLTLLERDSEPYKKPDESVDLKQEEKANRRSRNRLR
jgi:hypothetical protein